ncbi:MAG: SEL1-like repeat protein [Planctomycetes bacterium]|nr:SEL1-like repeat protein [Planctomycetota bacterium]
MIKLSDLLSRFLSRFAHRAEFSEENLVTHDAEQGDMIAQYTLAFMYETGRGAPQSDAEARKWYRKSAEQGHMGAKQKLKKFCKG